MRSIFSKTLATAMISGLIAGTSAFANEAAPEAPAADQAVAGKKDSCKGKKAECKGHAKKKGAKNACHGKNGCGEKKEEAPAPAAH